MKIADRPAQNQKGSFLLSTLLFMALISVVFTSVWQVITKKQETFQRVKVLNSRELAVTAALRNARVGSFYYKTIFENHPVNAMLINCLLDEGSNNDCAASNAGLKVDHPWRLIDDTNRPVIGSAASPVLYDIYGQVCTTPSAQCPFEVFSTFAAKCPTSAAVCRQAEYIDVTVNVQVHAMFQSLFPGMAVLTSTQKVSITDFKTKFNPVLPPPTNYGTPISSGAGPGGWITSKVEQDEAGNGNGNGNGNGGGGNSPPPATPPPTTTMSPCKPGNGAKADGSCGKFRF